MAHRNISTNKDLHTNKTDSKRLWLRIQQDTAHKSSAPNARKIKSKCKIAVARFVTETWPPGLQGENYLVKGLQKRRARSAAHIYLESKLAHIPFPPSFSHWSKTNLCHDDAAIIGVLWPLLMWLLCSVNQISGATTTLATPHHNHIELISRDLVLYVKGY